MIYQKGMPFSSNSIPQNVKFLDHILAQFFAELWVRHSIDIGVKITSPKKLHTVITSFNECPDALNKAYRKVSDVNPHASVFTVSLRTMLQVGSDKQAESMAMLGVIVHGLNFNLTKAVQKVGVKSERVLLELNNAVRTASKMIRLVWVDDKELFEMLSVYVKYVVRRTYAPFWNTILVERYIHMSGFLGQIESGRENVSEDMRGFLNDYDRTLLRCMTAKLVMLMTTPPKIERLQGLLSNTRYAPVDITTMFRVMDLWGEEKNQFKTRLRTATFNTFTKYPSVKQEIAEHAKLIVRKASVTGSGVPELALAARVSEQGKANQLINGGNEVVIASLLALGHYKKYKSYYVTLISTALVIAADSFCTSHTKYGVRSRLVRQLRRIVQSKSVLIFEQSGKFNTATTKVPPITCIGEYYDFDLFELGSRIDLKDLLKQKVI